jgi:spore coat protein A
LAGLYIIDDENKTQLFADVDLNATVYRDIPLAFADKIFGLGDGTEAGDAPLIYPYGVSDGDGGDLPAFSILPEMFGITMTVNGRIYPFLEVEPNGYYLLRLLNACDR